MILRKLEKLESKLKNINNMDLIFLKDKLTTAKFQFAKTMPQMPHWYTLRENWNDDEFVKVVKLIRKYGYIEKRSWGKEYTYFEIDGFKYWTMGEPINKNCKPWTVLINRADARR